MRNNNNIILTKIFLFFILGFFGQSYGEDITPEKIPSKLLDAIMDIESYKKDGSPYPYVISINDSKDIQKLKKYGYVIRKKRHIICYNERECEDHARFIINNLGIKNIDLGLYQVNYRWHGQYS